MRDYELVFIAQPDLDEEALTALVKRCTETVQNLGGQVLEVEAWGKRKLAYPIRKFREGFYFVVQLQLKADALGELERFLKLTEPIVRHLIVHVARAAQAVHPENKA